MRTKHLSILIHNSIKGEVSTVKHVYALQNFFLTDRSKAVLLLWIFFCYLCFVFVFAILSCISRNFFHQLFQGKITFLA